MSYTFYIECRDTTIEFVNEFCYLGITLTLKLSFSKHINRLRTKAATATASIKNLGLVSTTTGLRIYSIKIRPIINYCITIISPYLSANNLVELDKIKGTFIKRLLGVHWTT